MDNGTGCPVALIRSGVGLSIGGVVRAEKTGNYAVWMGVFCVRLVDLSHVRACSWNILRGASWLSRRPKIVRRARKVRDSKLAKSILSAQERKLLSETRDILEELLETEEIIRDKALTKSIKDSQEDVKAGRLYTVEELKSKLRREDKL